MYILFFFPFLEILFSIKDKVFDIWMTKNICGKSGLSSRKRFVFFSNYFILSNPDWLNTFNLINGDILYKTIEDRPSNQGLVTVSNHYSCIDEPLLWGEYQFYPQPHLSIYFLFSFIKMLFNFWGKEDRETNTRDIILVVRLSIKIHCLQLYRVWQKYHPHKSKPLLAMLSSSS